jgi:hypothetical protein
MWKIFSKLDSSIEKTVLSIESFKHAIFMELEAEVKAYFAEKIVVYFDNNMIFHHKKGLHLNLMDALSDAEQDMIHSSVLFGRIELYWIRGDDEQSIIIYGLPDDKENILIDHGFSLVERDIIPMSDKIEQLQYNAWKTLIFDAELVNYATGWINYTPDMEKRSQLQTEYILLRMEQKKKEMTIVEALKFEENIKQHSAYKELYNKVLRVMPKIENSLEQEWRTGTIAVNVKKQKTNI